MLDFAIQCCDAERYLELGRQCAENGQCYDGLRPLGVVLWFAWPLFLGLPQETLIWVHAALLLVSVLLGAAVGWRWLNRAAPDGQPQWLGAVILLASLVTHAVFFYPVLPYALSDAPAALFVLIALWLILLSGLGSGGSPLWLALAGVLLGLAAWLRTFYLYPLGVVLMLAAALVIVRPQQHKVLLYLGFALLPVMAQYVVSYQANGHVAYLASRDENKLRSIHLYRDSSVGYDTLLPARVQRWYAPCQVRVSLYASLMTGQWQDAVCLMRYRLNFYLGSYLSVTYPQVPLAPLGSENLLHAGATEVSVLDLAPDTDAFLAPDNTWSALRLVTVRADDKGSGQVSGEIGALAPGFYTFSAWLWSPVPHTLSLTVYEPETLSVLAVRRVELTPDPVRYSVTVNHVPSEGHASALGLALGRFGDQAVGFGRQPGEYLYLWSPKLESGPTMTVDAGMAPPANPRYWSGWLVAAHALMTVALLGLLWQSRWGLLHAGILLPGLMLGLILAQAVIVTPEQRFLLVFQVMLWVLGLTGLLSAGVRVVRGFRFRTTAC